MALVPLSAALASASCSSDETGAASGSPSGSGASSSAGTGGEGGEGTGGAGGQSGGTGGSGGEASGAGGSGGQGGGSAIVCDEPSGAAPKLKLTPVVNGLERPIYVTSEPSDATRLYVVEQTGFIKLIKNGALESEPFLDATSLINDPDYPQDEKGLLGLAFHPSYAQNGRFFIYYNAAQGSALTLAELSRASNNPDKAEAGANGQPAVKKVFFSVEEGVQTNHNGGMLAFSPKDGLLYVGVGDGGGSGDPNNHGQNIDVKLGKILRIDVDKHPMAPAGNLPGGDPDIWDYGLRNPWRFSFDSCNGDLYIGDVGQGLREEIDVEPAGQGNRNYGWSTTEGTVCYKPMQGCDMTGIELPAKEYDHNSGGCSVNGGYVYRGSKIPGLRGTYFYGDYCSKQIWTFVWKGGAAADGKEISGDLGALQLLQAPSSFGQDADGELYVVDLAGTVYRIEAE